MDEEKEYEQLYMWILDVLSKKGKFSTEIKKNTPKRASNALIELTSGYNKKEEDVLGKTFEEKGSDVVYETVEFYSLCEHHLLPFYGKVHIAYMPSKNVVGLSKLARLVEMYSRRLQIQERLTNQVADALWFNENLHPKAVFVMVEGKHLCMMQRGVKKQETVTVTTAARGLYAVGDNAHRFREEILMVIKRQQRKKHDKKS